MSKTTTTQKQEHDPKKDLSRMKRLMNTYSELMNEKEKLQEKAAEKLSPILESLSAAQAEMVIIAQRNKKQFDKKGNWEVGDEGYLHVAEKAEVITSKKFNMGDFVKKFPDYVNTTFKLAKLKPALLGGDTRKPFTDAGIDIKVNKEYQVIVRK